MKLYGRSVLISDGRCSLFSSARFRLLTDGRNFVSSSLVLRRPVVVVAINYRLNFFGFLSSMDIAKDVKEDSDYSEHGASFGNWGLLDQKMAFEWVSYHPFLVCP
jgi:carboxylesterase type B